MMSITVTVLNSAISKALNMSIDIEVKKNRIINRKILSHLLEVRHSLELVKKVMTLNKVRPDEKEM